MTYMINAWLDKPQPELQLVEPMSGVVVACWKGRRLNDLFDSGLVSYEELRASTPERLKLVEKALILQMTCEELCGRCLYNSQ